MKSPDRPDSEEFARKEPLMKKIIYDFGANNGDDIPYYLLKSDLVVAVEANPALCDLITERFHSQLRAGRLVLEKCVVVAEGKSGLMDFYVHKYNHVLSQLLPPSPENASQFEKVLLPSRNVADIIRNYGSPHYVKIDIEGYDAHVLRGLFAAGIFPSFISAESHSIDVFALLVAQGRYSAFKLVDGPSVSHVYRNRRVTSGTQGEQIRYSFPYHSAGPFGDDIDGPWVTADDFLRVLAFEGLGWKDIHASNEVPAAAISPLNVRRWFVRYLLRATNAKCHVIATRLRRMLGLSRF
jgi:FkbM family methyltransferase